MTTSDEIFDRANVLLKKYEDKLVALEEMNKRKREDLENSKKLSLVTDIVNCYEKIGEPIDPKELMKESVDTLTFFKTNAEKLAEKFKHNIFDTDETSGIVDRDIGADEVSDIMSNEEKRYSMTDKVLDMISLSMGLPIATKEEKDVLRMEHRAQGIIY